MEGCARNCPGNTNQHQDAATMRRAFIRCSFRHRLSCTSLDGDFTSTSGLLPATAALLSVSHQRMHETNEFNCHLNAFFMINPTSSAVLPPIRIHRSRPPGGSQLTFLCQSLDQTNDRPHAPSSAEFCSWCAPLRRLTAAA